MYCFDEIKSFDPDLARAMELEIQRQEDHIELIASENFVSKAVMAAMGSPLTNKYAEGYPGKNACYRTGKAALWLHLRQCSAAFRRPGQYGRLFCPADPGRYGHGHES